MKIHSDAFHNGENIPMEQTCSGADISPPLSWSSAPEGTKSFTLIADDPDAPNGTWVHWLAYNIPANTTSLPANVPPIAENDHGMKQGTSSFGNIGYGGPCPPIGHGPHRYYFKLYALDTLLDIPSGANKAALTAAMQGHILAEAQTMGRFERP